MTENLFQSGPPSHDESPPRKIGGGSIVWHIIRFAFGFFLFVVVPFSVAPEFSDMFEEFGIELPVITRSFMTISDMVCKWFIIFVPQIFIFLLCVEIGLYLLPKENGKRLYGSLWWLCLILVLVFYVIAISIPVMAIISGLNA